MMGVAGVLWVAGVSGASSQNVTVRGIFQSDTVRIGDPVAYTLTARYPRNLQVLFPDSTFNFFPFEFQSKKYFPTQTTDSISYDSAVYYLANFELDSATTLGLPVFVAHQLDCTRITAPPDEIQIKSLIRSLPDSISLHDLGVRETLDYQPVRSGFGYVLAVLITGALTMVAAIVWIFFGDRIVRHYQVRRLQQNHSQFLDDYTATMKRLSQDANPSAAESVMLVWKRYLENLERTPYTKLTTRETIRLVQNDALATSLQNIDRTIYGRQQVNMQSFDGLKDFAHKKFEQKLAEVMHG